LEGRTLTLVSDLHVGAKDDDEYIIQSFRRGYELAPDFVVVTGDWITSRSPRQFEKLRRVLGHMPHGLLGTVGILGNHDYGLRWRRLDVADQVSAIARGTGVPILLNNATASSTPEVPW